MNTPTPDNNFYCKEWNNVGFICEEQCDNCKCHDKPTREEMTPTPEQLQEFKEWCKVYYYPLVAEMYDEDWIEEYKSHTAYANHVLMSKDSECIKAMERLEGIIKKEAIDRWVSELRKLAALQEQVNYWVEHWNLRDKQANDLQQQLTEARKEIDGLKSKI